MVTVIRGRQISLLIVIHVKQISLVIVIHVICLSLSLYESQSSIQLNVCMFCLFV